MLAFLAVALAALASCVVRAQTTPTGPAPGQIFKEGGPCLIQWIADTTGTWKVAYIELMTGDNFNMVHLTTVGQIDGTSTTNTSLTWTCPKVTLHSAVYFYQFTSAGTASPEWTGRFAIVGADGTEVPPPNSTQPNGAAIPWGTGSLSDPSLATPAPPTSPEFSGSESGSVTVLSTTPATSAAPTTTSSPTSAPVEATSEPATGTPSPTPSAAPTGGSTQETTLSFIVMTLAAAFAIIISF